MERKRSKVSRAKKISLFVSRALFHSANKAASGIRKAAIKSKPRINAIIRSFGDSNVATAVAQESIIEQIQEETRKDPEASFWGTLIFTFLLAGFIWFLSYLWDSFQVFLNTPQ